MALDPKDSIDFYDDGTVSVKEAGKLAEADVALAATFTEINKVCDVSSRLVDCTDSTLSVTAALHAGKIVTLNRAAGIAVTLPEATGTGNKYTFYVGTTISSNTTVIAALTTDTMVGGVGVATDIAGVTVQAGSTDDKLTMSGSTTGGVVGSVVHCTDIADTLWLVEGQLVSTGNEADPFGAT